jgi:hypothetical protein
VSSRHCTPWDPQSEAAGKAKSRELLSSAVSLCRRVPLRLALLRGAYAIVTAWGQPFRPCAAKEPLATSVEAKASPRGTSDPLARAWHGRPRPTLQLLIFEASPQRKAMNQTEREDTTL